MPITKNPADFLSDLKDIAKNYKPFQLQAHFLEEWKKSPMRLFCNFADATAAEKVGLLNNLLAIDDLRFLFWAEKFSGRPPKVVEALFLDDNPVEWLISLLNEPNLDIRRETAQAILELLTNQSARLLTALRSHDGSMPEGNFNRLIYLIDQLTAIPNLREVEQKELYIAYDYSSIPNGVQYLLDSFKSNHLNAEMLCELVENQARLPIARGMILDYWGTITSKFTEQKLTLEQLIFLKTRLFNIPLSLVTPNEIQSLNDQSLRFLTHIKSLGLNQFMRIYTPDYFYTARITQKSPRFFNSLFEMVEPILTQSLGYVTADFFKAGLAAALSDQNPRSAIEYLKLFKQHAPGKLVEYDFFTEIMNIIDSYAANPASNLSLMNLMPLFLTLTQEFNLPADSFEILQSHSDMLCAYLLNMNTSPLKRRAVLEALLPDSQLNQVLSKNREHTSALYEEISSPGYEEQLIVLACNPSMDATALYKLKEISKNILMAYFQTEKGSRHLKEALHPSGQLYEFLGRRRHGLRSTGELFINHDCDDLDKLRKNHPAVLLDMIRENQFDERYFNSLTDARPKLIQCITNLPNNEIKQSLFVELLEKSDFPLFKFIRHGHTNSTVNALIENNLDVIIELINQEKLSGDTLVKPIGEWRIKIAEYISSVATNFLAIAKQIGTPLYNFLLVNAPKKAKEISGILDRASFSGLDPNRLFSGSASSSQGPSQEHRP